MTMGAPSSICCLISAGERISCLDMVGGVGGRGSDCRNASLSGRRAIKGRLALLQRRLGEICPCTVRIGGRKGLSRGASPQARTSSAALACPPQHRRHVAAAQLGPRAASRAPLFTLSTAWRASRGPETVESRTVWPQARRLQDSSSACACDRKVLHRSPRAWSMLTAHAIGARTHVGPRLSAGLAASKHPQILAGPCESDALGPRC